MTALLTMTAIGIVLGLRFKVFALVPAIVVSLIGSVAIGVGHGSGIWPNLLAILSVITGLQIGYIAGSVLRLAVGKARDRKNQSAIVAVAQRN